MDVGDFSLADAGVLPFPLHKFEALQHGHLRRAVNYVDRKMAEALSLVAPDGPLACLLHDGRPYEVSVL